MRFVGYEQMLAELRRDHYESPVTESDIFERQLTKDRIVYLYNIHCIPKNKFQNNTYSSAR